MSSRWKERNAKTRRDRRCKEENPCPSEEGALAWDRQLCLDQWRWTRIGWRQPQEIQQVRKESKRTSETPQSTWLGGAQKAQNVFANKCGELEELHCASARIR